MAVTCVGRINDGVSMSSAQGVAPTRLRHFFRSDGGLTPTAQTNAALRTRYISLGASFHPTLSPEPGERMGYPQCNLDEARPPLKLAAPAGTEHPTWLVGGQFCRQSSTPLLFHCFGIWWYSVDIRCDHRFPVPAANWPAGTSGSARP